MTAEFERIAWERPEPEPEPQVQIPLSLGPGEVQSLLFALDIGHTHLSRTWKDRPLQYDELKAHEVIGKVRRQISAHQNRENIANGIREQSKEQSNHEG